MMSMPFVRLVIQICPLRFSFVGIGVVSAGTLGDMGFRGGRFRATQHSIRISAGN